MALEMWSNVLRSSLFDLWNGVLSFVPSVLAAIIIFIFGWIVGAALGRVVAQIVHSLPVDRALRSAGVEDDVHQAGFRLNSGAFLGGLVKWFIIVVFLVAALDVLGLTQVTVFLNEVVLMYMPKVIAAVLILLVAAVIAEVLQNIVVGAAKAADMTSAQFLGNVTRWAIWGFA